MKTTAFPSSLLIAALCTPRAADAFTDTACPAALVIRAVGELACQYEQTAFSCDAAGTTLRSLGIARRCEVRMLVGPESSFQTVGTLLRSLDRAGYKHLGFVTAGASP